MKMKNNEIELIQKMRKRLPLATVGIKSGLPLRAHFAEKVNLWVRKLPYFVHLAITKNISNTDVFVFEAIQIP